MAAPLLGESRLIGSMVIANRLTEGTTFGDDDLRLLETLANQAAVALENGQLEQSLAELSRLKEELRYQAYHDPLTGLANRSLFIERVDEALAGPDGDRVPSCLFLDLDNFKDVNDSLGHAAGDRLLVAVADRVRSMHPDRRPGRPLAATSSRSCSTTTPRPRRALAVADAVIDALAAPFPIEGQDLKVSASVGDRRQRSRGERADDLLRNADVAMYTAKQGGRTGSPCAWPCTSRRRRCAAGRRPAPPAARDAMPMLAVTRAPGPRPGTTRRTRQDPGRDRERVAQPRVVVEQDRELVAAQPRGDVAGPDARPDPVRDRDEQPVARRVAQRVVDVLEVVEVEEQHGRDRRAARGPPVAAIPAAIASSTCSRNRLRLASPVSGSW